MQAELKRIASELRAYNPAADEYKGEHIHKVWAREIEAVLAGQSAGVPEGWRELCRRLYVELFHCDQQMRSTLDQDGDPHWTQSAVVRDVLKDAKAALSAAPAPVSEPAPDREQATLCEDGGKCGIGGYCGQCEKVRAASEPEQPSERVEQACPHGVDDGACKQCYGEAVREGRQGCRMPTGDELRAAARSVGSLGTNHGDASHEYVVAGWKACMDACKAASAPTLGEAIYQHDQGDGFWKDVPYAEWQLLGAKWRRIVYTTPASAPTLSGGDGEVAVRAKTVHRRIDALCEAANTAGADYFDASTSMLIATRDLLTALGFPHRMAEPKEYGGSCEDCKWSAISGGGLCDGCAQAAEPKGVTDEERKQIDNALDMLLCAMRAANWEGDAAYSAGEKARALLANGE
ncbi:hypothetical protein CIW54_07515 [Paraburkholderia sp. T12-10]|nr:hypothetical protein CIW54_07515 [Paraburkholderia sp. T12-10]